jgi:GNAT superfamily N-acetyltransferase
MSPTGGAPHLRPARLGDASAIAELSTQLGYPSTGEEVIRRLAGLAEHGGDEGVLVAELPSRGVVGWIHVSLLRHLESELYAEIVGLVVHEKARGLGVGAALVAAARTWALDRGLSRLDVRTNVVREDAHRFYEREGFRAVKQQSVMTLAIRPGARGG